MSRAQWLLVWQLFAISKALLLPSTPSRINRANIRCSASDDDRHEKWMRYALSLAERGRLSTAPNPWVGCVIVAGDGEEILAEGFHKQKGGPHAEATALANAKERGITREQMEAATCYVTLEPCHRGPGKTTPPCDEALVAQQTLRVLSPSVLSTLLVIGSGLLVSSAVQPTLFGLIEPVPAPPSRPPPTPPPPALPMPALPPASPAASVIDADASSALGNLTAVNGTTAADTNAAAEIQRAMPLDVDIPRNRDPGAHVPERAPEPERANDLER